MAVTSLSPPRSGSPARRGPAGAGARLRRRLLDEGPIAAAFGIYLGSRVDLLPGVDCLRLLEIPDRGPPSRSGRVRALIEGQLGGSPEELFEVFDPQPFDSGLLTQWHRARLPGGGPVAVELTHPELEGGLADGGLRTLVERLIAAGELPAGARAAVRAFERRLDLGRAAEGLVELGEEQAGSQWVEVPALLRRLCAPRIRSLAAVGGWPPPPPGPAAPVGGERRRRRHRARRLSRTWLVMALGGELFPGAPWGRNLAWLDDGRLAVLGGPAHRLPRALRLELREYLAAVAAREPVRAAQALCELLPEGRAERRLRTRLRHTDPFRDRGCDVGGDRVARQVLAHWRTAAELGHELPAGLAPFYRGLFLLNQEVRRLTGESGGDGGRQLAAGESTALCDGLREARLVLLLGELRDREGVGRWAGSVGLQASLLSAVPRKLDRILTLAAGDDRPAAGRRHAASGRRRRVRPEGWAPVAACLLALGAVAALSDPLTRAGGPGAAVAEGLAALLVLLLGGLALWAAAR